MIMPKVYLYLKNEIKRNQIIDLCNLLKVETSLLCKLDLKKTLKEIINTNNSNVEEIDGEEVIIFEDFTQGQLEMFLGLYKERNIEDVSLKAVITPYNLEWTLDKLINELKKEREYYNNK